MLHLQELLAYIAQFSFDAMDPVNNNHKTEDNEACWNRRLKPSGKTIPHQLAFPQPNHPRAKATSKRSQKAITMAIKKNGHL